MWRNTSIHPSQLELFPAVSFSSLPDTQPTTSDRLLATVNKETKQIKSAFLVSDAAAQQYLYCIRVSLCKTNRRVEYNATT